MTKKWTVDQQYELLERLNIIKVDGEMVEYTDEWQEYFKGVTIIEKRDPTITLRQQRHLTIMHCVHAWRPDLPGDEVDQIAVFILASLEITEENVQLEKLGEKEND